MTAAFAIGGLALSAVLSILTYELARTYLLRQRETSLLRQAYVNARLTRSALRSTDTDVQRFLSSLETPSGSHPVLYRAGRWYANDLATGPDALPRSLRAAAMAGHAARQRVVRSGVPELAVAIPLPDQDAIYFEVFGLEVLDRTLAVLRNSLVGAGAVTTLAAAALGRVAAGRLLRPVTAAAAAAGEVAGGDLRTRLDADDDPDLMPLARAFNEMTEALAARIERDERFAAAVSHELRSPLTTLANAVGVLEARREELPESARAALGLLSEEIARFERLVQDLLEISRSASGVPDHAAEPVRLAEFVLRVVQMHAPQALGVDVDATAIDTVVAVDKRRLERAIVNLLENAAAHGDGASVVTVGCDGSVAIVAVEDNGPGVPVGERERVFEPFVRGRAAGRRGAGHGSGLGLALVREHVRRHGGEVHIEDGRNGGARFVITLPVVDA